MFGFSLPKLLVLVLIVGAIWYGYKWMSRIGEREDDPAKLKDGATGGDGSRDLVECPACGAYAPAGIEKCPEGRADCPLVKG